MTKLAVRLVVSLLVVGGTRNDRLNAVIGENSQNLRGIAADHSVPGILLLA
jgi:hypothetical protein